MRCSELYKKVPFKRLRELWEQDANDVRVYVHNPFCASMCRYCFYKGTPLKEFAYRKYYYEYLPRVIELYADVLKDKKVISYFFGGGTPSLMKPDTMRHVFDLFPKKFKKVENKIFELHPAYWSKEQIDVLAEYKFGTIIVGVQTFDRKTLERQNRTPHTFDDVKRIVQQAKMNGMNVAVDLIVFLNRDMRDIEIFHDDIRKCLKLDVDEISIQNDYRLKGHNLAFDQMVVEKVFGLPETQSGKYIAERSHEQVQELMSSLKCLRIFKKDALKKDGSFFSFTVGMDEGSKIAIDRKCSVMGIGSYLNMRKNTFSDIGNEVEYIEINEGWKPRFYMVRKPDYFAEATSLMKRIRLLGLPPHGMKLTIENRMTIEGEDTLMRRSAGLAAYVQVLATKAGKDYVGKLRKAFPKLKKQMVRGPTGEEIHVLLL